MSNWYHTETFFRTVSETGFYAGKCKKNSYAKIRILLIYVLHLMNYIPPLIKVGSFQISVQSFLSGRKELRKSDRGTFHTDIMSFPCACPDDAERAGSGGPVTSEHSPPKGEKMSRISHFTTFILCFAIAAALCLAVSGTGDAKTRMAFSGGPDGGTFQYFSNAIATRISKNTADPEILNMTSPGSVENLRRVNSGDADFGIVYSADLYLGRNGKLINDTQKYDNICSMSYLYGAPAHLVVPEESGIRTVRDLMGKRIAVGMAGSGAAASAQRYLTFLGIWDQVSVEYIGYTQAAAAIGDRRIDAMWVLAGFPNSSVAQAASGNRIAMLNLAEEGKESGFFREFPFYTQVVIPAGTYRGVEYDVQVFQDAAVWVAGKHVKPEIVQNVLKEIYSPEGLAYMVSVTPAAKAMNVKNGLLGIVTPVHKGAAQFWTDAGLPLTPEQKGEHPRMP